MKKFITALGLAMLIAAPIVIAASGDLIAYGPSEEFRVTSAGVVVATGFTGGLTGDITGDVTGDVTGIVKETVTAVAPTNSAVITLTAGINVVSPYGGANDTTNTCTVANVASADVGKSYTIVLGASATNLLKLADSGSLKLAGDFIGDNNDSVKVVAIATNVLVEVSRSNN